MVAEQTGDVQVRLVRPGEWTAVASLVGSAYGELAAAASGALDVHGGQLPLGVAAVPSGLGWCFGAYHPTGLVAVLYACAPVEFIRTFPLDQRQGLVRSVIEIEIMLWARRSANEVIATTLLRHAEDQFAQLGLRYIVAKVDATAMPVLRWYRHRGYTLAREGEHLAIETPDATAGLDAGDSNRWRLAVAAPGNTVTRRGTALKSSLAFQESPHRLEVVTSACCPCLIDRLRTSPPLKDLVELA